MSKKRIIIPLLIVMGLLLTAGVIYADLKMNNPVRAWDLDKGKYTHDLQPMPMDCVTWIPFWYEFAWDGDVYPTGNDIVARYYSGTYETVAYPLDACPNDGLPKPPGAYSTTPWASVFEYAVYHIDNPPDEGYGFKDTRNWELIECDRNGDDVFKQTGQPPGNDMYTTPPYSRSIIIDDPGDINLGFEVLAQNAMTGAASVGNAQYELITTLFVNPDTNCDGDITEADGERIFNAWSTDIGLCFYAEALVPCPGDPLWKGNVQARVSRLGGEVTINFHQDPEITPVELSSFTARWYEDPSRSLIVGAVVAVLGGAAVGALVWRTRPARR